MADIMAETDDKKGVSQQSSTADFTAGEKQVTTDKEVAVLENKVLSNQNSHAELGSQPAPSSRKRFWFDDIDPKRSDLILLACCFVTGLLDTSTFRNWAVFVSMQTGNTIILCLSTAGYPIGQPFAYGATIISLAAFFIGAFVTTRLSLLLGPKRRVVLTLNFVAQALLIVIGAALATSDVLLNDQESSPDKVLTNARVLIGIAPLAWQSGATIATSRLLGYGNEIPVTVYTSTYAALAADPKLFHLHGNAPRNRRIAAVLSVFAGSFVATWLEKVSAGMIATFWMSAGIKFVLAGCTAIFLPTKQPAPGH